MKNNLAGVLCAVLMLLLGGCVNLTKIDQSIQKEWQSGLIAGASSTLDKPILQEHLGVVYQIRYAAAAKLMVRNLRTGLDSLVWDGGAEQMRADGIASYSDGRNIYVAWRPKLNKNHPSLGNEGDKMVFVASSSDGVVFSAPKRISNANGAFTPVFTGTENGDTYAVWQDERFSKTLDLYFNVSHDGGVTWKLQDVRLDGGEEGSGFSAEPSISAQNADLSVAWVETTKDGFVVFVRTSMDRGESWGAPVSVATSSKPIYYPQLVRSKGNLAVYWYDTNRVLGSASVDNGVTWMATTVITDLAESGGTVHGLLVKADKTGVIHLIHSARGAGSDDRSNQFYYRSDDGNAFSQAYRLNSGKPFEATASLPSMAFDENSNILVAWVDYRYFRSVIMGVYSSDNGKSWSKDFLLSKPPETGIAQFPYSISSSNRLWVSFIQYDIENQEAGYAVAVPLSSILSLKSPITAIPPDATKLQKRVTDWWQSRLDADWKKSYEYLDPFLHQRLSEKQYIESQGTVKYYDFEYLGMEMVGERRAVAKVKYTFEVPTIEINGRKVSVPKKETEVNQDWIWLDGRWYLMFKDIMGKSSIEQ